MKKGRGFRLMYFVQILVGIGVGIAAGVVIQNVEDIEPSLFKNGYSTIIVIAALFFSFLLETVLHELGHLAFGKAYGGKFLSIRFGRLMILKKDGRLQLKSYTVSGTGGQCLIAPPAQWDNKKGAFLYLSGGVVFNLLAALISFLLGYLARADNPFAYAFFTVNALVGGASAVLNGIPMAATVPNDAYSAQEVWVSPEARRALWIQLKVGEAQAEGIRLKELPASLFWFDEEAAKKSYLCAAVGAFIENRLMDQRELDKALEQITKMLTGDYQLAPLYASQMTLDELYIMAVKGTGTPQLAQAYLQVMPVLRQMSYSPQALRTEYAFYQCVDPDDAAAQKVLKRFEKLARSYPYSQEIDSERELIELARKASAERRKAAPAQPEEKQEDPGASQDGQ
jgi:hypothetical protein